MNDAQLIVQFSEVVQLLGTCRMSVLLTEDGYFTVVNNNTGKVLCQASSVSELRMQALDLTRGSMTCMLIMAQLQVEVFLSRVLRQVYGV